MEPTVAYLGLEDVPEQIAESLRQIRGADSSEDALFSDLVASGWDELDLRGLIDGGPYWIAPYSDAAYAYHHTSSCPTLARSRVEVVSGYHVATNGYVRCSVCGRW